MIKEFIESRTWNGNVETTGEALDFIGPSIAQSRRAVAPAKPKETNPGRKRGRVGYYHEPKGFGFIMPDDGGIDLFFHVKDAIEPGLTYFEKGERVSFEVGESRKGQPAAIKIQLDGGNN